MFLKRNKRITPSLIKYRFSQLILDKICNKYGCSARRSLWMDVKDALRSESPIIIDGGSNIGDITALFISQYSNPTIYSIEANPELARRQKARFVKNKNIIIINKAIGQQDHEMTFNISKNINSSSFLIRSALSKKYHGDLTDINKKIDITMTRLDKLFNDESVIDLLKLDLEGYELEALKGAEGILNKVRLIVTEVWFVEMYCKAPYFSDVETYLRNKNFELLNLYNLYTHKDMRLTMGDAVFKNKRFFK